MLPKYGAFQQTTRVNNHLPNGQADSRRQICNVLATRLKFSVLAPILSHDRERLESAVYARIFAA